MDKRTTSIIYEANWKHYEKLKIQKISDGKGDLSFSKYLNTVLSMTSPTLEQIIEELKRIKAIKN